MNLPDTLSGWLAFQLAGSRNEIVLGLDRVRAVAAELGLGRPAPLVVSVAGTNGKGSTVAFLEAIARAGGRRVGAYTSPHLLRYNERIRIDGVDVSDRQLCAVFARIETARAKASVPLTYFEHSTLAALQLFADAGLDLAILEVGLGGRLDAVNLVDADVAIVTSIDLDHQDWLGHDRDSIAREKAGIFRSGAIAVLAERAPREALLERAREVGADTLRAGEDYDWHVGADGWSWRSSAGRELALPPPHLAGEVQLANASAAIAALDAIGPRLPLEAAAFAQGVGSASVAGRLQGVESRGRSWLLDVAHNPQAAGVLMHWLDVAYPKRSVVAVFGGLADKDTAGIVAPLQHRVRHWFCGGLDAQTPRGLPGETLAQRVRDAGASASAHATIEQALEAACAKSEASDLIVCFGSFFVVAATLQALGTPAT